MAKIKSENQLRSLVSPVRQEIVDVLAAMGPSTVAELAEVLGSPPDGLYYHVRRLLEVDLLREVDRRRAGKRFEAVYDLPDRDARVAYVLDDRRIMDPLVDAVSAMLRLADRDFRAGVDLPVAVGDGRDRNIWAGRTKAWLTRSEARRVREHLEAIAAIARGAKRTPSSHLHTISWVMTPASPNERAAKEKE